MTSYSLQDVIGEEFGVIVLDGPREVRATYGDTHNLEDAVRGLADKFYRDKRGWWDRRNRAISLYLNLMGFDCTIQMLRGYSQGEWCEIVLIRKRNTVWDQEGYNIVDTVPYVNAWFAGDIYSIVHEKLETFANVNDPEDTVEQWREVDSISCQMLLESKDFVQIAKIEFDIPKTDYLVKIG
jgi:hypothetical protein